MSTITVAGGVNIDIVAGSLQPLIPCDSNPGTVRVSLGGVGRNIAENLSRLGHDVRLLTALGGDANVQLIENGCAQLGIDLSHALRVPDGRCSTYVALHDDAGEMRLAISDMEICDALTPAYFEPLLPMLNASDAVVLDANLQEETLRFLAQHITVPLFADTVSTAKTPRITGILPYLNTLQCNRVEAALLSGQVLDTDDDVFAAAHALRARGAKRVIITLGAQGAAYADADGQGIVPALPLKPLCTTGCGDSFLSACVHAFLRGQDTQGMMRTGLAAASYCSQSQSAVHPLLSEQTLAKHMNTYAT